MTITPANPVISITINKENWQIKKNKLKEKFPHLTESDLEYEEGKVVDMIDKLHSKIGKTIGKSKEELHKFIDAL